MRVLSESKRKVGKAVPVKDEEEWEQQYAEYVETVIEDKGNFIGTTVRREAGRVFLDAAGEPILPLFRLVKCRCKRKLKIWLVSRDPAIWAGRCSRCKGAHFVGGTDAVKRATRRERRDWLRKAKKTRKKHA